MNAKEFWQNLAEKVTQNVVERLVELEVALTTKSLVEANIKNLTQDGIHALTLATSSNIAKKLAVEMQQKSLTASTPVQAKMYDVISSVLNVEVNSYNKKLAELAKQEYATVAANPFDTANHVAGNKFNSTMY